MVYVPRVRLLAPLLLGIAAAPLAGCGYEFVRHPDARSVAGAPTIAVTTLRNDSVEPGYELEVTGALLREILRRGALRLVDAPEQADFVLSGRVEPIDSRARTFSSIVLALEYELSVTLDLSLRMRDGGEVALARELLTETEFYTASPDVEAMRKNRDEALRRVASVLAARVHDALSARDWGAVSASPAARSEKAGPEP